MCVHVCEDGDIYLNKHQLDERALTPGNTIVYDHACSTWLLKNECRSRLVFQELLSFTDIIYYSVIAYSLCIFLYLIFLFFEYVRLLRL